MSKRWACRVVKRPRGTQRYRPTRREDEDRLTQAIIVLAGQYVEADFTGAGLPLGDILKVQNFWTTDLIEAACFWDSADLLL